jgi:hypothetical protein
MHFKLITVVNSVLLGHVCITWYMYMKFTYMLHVAQNVQIKLKLKITTFFYFLKVLDVLLYRTVA